MPDDGRPWLYDGFTCRLLVDGAILRADDSAFRAAAPQSAAAIRPAPMARQPTVRQPHGFPTRPPSPIPAH